MADRGPDPYQILGISSDASDAELRATYRRLVQLHHPDHNSGSAESARRFEDVQEAYAQIRMMRQATVRGDTGPGNRPRPGAGPTRPATADADPNMESRLADLERELREARIARDRARRAAREAAQAARPPSDRVPRRPSDEELGYIETDDSFAKILADAAAEVSQRLSDVWEHDAPKHVPKRVTEVIDELAAKLAGEPPTR